MCNLQLFFFHCPTRKKKCILFFFIADCRLETAAATFVEAILGLLKCKSTCISYTASINVDHDIVRYIFRVIIVFLDTLTSELLECLVIFYENWNMVGECVHVWGNS